MLPSQFVGVQPSALTSHSAALLSLSFPSVVGFAGLLSFSVPIIQFAALLSFSAPVMEFAALLSFSVPISMSVVMLRMKVMAAGVVTSATFSSWPLFKPSSVTHQTQESHTQQSHTVDTYSNTHISHAQHLHTW